MIFHQPSNSRGNYNYNAYFYTNEVWNFHFHKNLELIYVLQGTLHCTVNHVEYCLHSGEFGLCLPYDIHCCQPEPDTRYWIGVFSEEYVRLFTRQIEGKTGTGFAFRCPQPVEAYLVQQMVHNAEPSLYTLKSCLYAVCDEYMRSVPLAESSTKKNEMISRIADYVRQHHTQKIGLSDVAELLGYDYHYVSRWFRTVFHMTFTEFLNLYRLETAIRLLEETDGKVAAISYECGFQSVRSFNHFFKGAMGVSPTEYRKTARH